MDELNLDHALNVRRALIVGPFLCLSALSMVLWLGSPVPLSVPQSTIQATAAIVVVVAEYSVLLVVAVVVMLALIRVATGRCFRILAVAEVLGGAIVLAATLVIAGAVWCRELAAPMGDQSSISLILKSVIALTVIGCFYAFMYPRRLDPPTGEVSTHDVLYGGARAGPERALSRTWSFALILGAFAIVILADSATPGLVAAASAGIALLAWRSTIGPGIVSVRSATAFRILDDLRYARHLRRNSSYWWYVLRAGEDRRTAAAKIGRMLLVLCCSVALGYVGGPVSLLMPAGLIIALALYREALGSLAGSIPEAETDRIQRTADFTLYLRSFNDDDFQFDLWSAGWRRLWPLILHAGLIARFVRFEEFIVRTLWRYRPVVAVSGLEGSTSRVGALQLPVSELTWRHQVLNSAAKSRVIVSVVGSTPGVIWEVQTLLQNSEFRPRTFFLLPQEEAGAAIERWRAAFGSVEGVAMETIDRTIIVKPHLDGRLTLITAKRRSADAYGMSLDLVEVMIARES